MKTVNIGVLKNDLSAYLRYVRSGEEVIVRDRNVPVARIVPFRAAGIAEEEAELAGAGILKMPQQELDWAEFWALPRPAVPDEAVDEAIRWAKGDR